MTPPSPAAVRPFSSLSIDLDDRWSYLRTRGIPEWAQARTFLDTCIPRALELLRSRGLKVTFFVVGKDARRPELLDFLKAIVQDGHEIANHSFDHDPCLEHSTEAKVEGDILSCHEAIERATGVSPRGFRAPGFSLSTAVLGVLARHDYAYDASTCPTFTGPLARAYFSTTKRSSGAERERDRTLYGAFADGLRPLRPYLWQAAGRRLVEIPVTTFPGLRMPIHGTYLAWLRQYSAGIARRYFDSALSLCRLRGIAPSLLLHPTDLLDREDAPELGYFPGMTLSKEVKSELVTGMLDRVSSEFEIVGVGEHARRATRGGPLRVVSAESGLR